VCKEPPKRTSPEKERFPKTKDHAVDLFVNNGGQGGAEEGEVDRSTNFLSRTQCPSFSKAGTGLPFSSKQDGIKKGKRRKSDSPVRPSFALVRKGVRKKPNNGGKEVQVFSSATRGPRKKKGGKG